MLETVLQFQYGNYCTQLRLCASVTKKMTASRRGDARVDSTSHELREGDIQEPGIEGERTDANMESYLSVQSKPIFDDFDSEQPSPTQPITQQCGAAHGKKPDLHGIHDESKGHVCQSGEEVRFTVLSQKSPPSGDAIFTQDGRTLLTRD